MKNKKESFAKPIYRECFKSLFLISMFIGYPSGDLGYRTNNAKNSGGISSKPALRSPLVPFLAAKNKRDEEEKRQAASEEGMIIVD